MRRARPRALVTVAVVTVAVTMAMVAACAAPRNSLNTGASVCFRSLAVAEDAVHHKGRLVGVRRVSAESFARHVPEAPRLPDKEAVCLVAFRGDYREGDVVGAAVPRSGRYALVAVATGKPTLLGSRVTDHLPIRFGHEA